MKCSVCSSSIAWHNEDRQITTVQKSKEKKLQEARHKKRASHINNEAKFYTKFQIIAITMQRRSSSLQFSLHPFAHQPCCCCCFCCCCNLNASFWLWFIVHAVLTALLHLYICVGCVTMENSISHESNVVWDADWEPTNRIWTCRLLSLLFITFLTRTRLPM